jgi:transcriptional antiterminator RfaH
VLQDHGSSRYRSAAGQSMEQIDHLQGKFAIADSAFDAPWYLAYTKPRQEQVAQMNLQKQAFETYLYKALSKKLAADDTQATEIFEPMFARYVFFRPSNPRQSIATARSTRGLSNIVSFGFEMATIRSDTIATIRACEQKRNVADISTCNPFQKGDKVRFRTDGLLSLEGLVEGVSVKRVKLLLEILGRQKIVTVEHFLVELT